MCSDLIQKSEIISVKRDEYFVLAALKLQPSKGYKHFLKNISIALQHSKQSQPQHLRLEPQIGVLTRSSSANFVGFVPLKCTVLMFTIPAVNLLGSQQGIKEVNNRLLRALDSHQFQTYALRLSHPWKVSPFGAPGLVDAVLHFGEALLSSSAVSASLLVN